MDGEVFLEQNAPMPIYPMNSDKLAIMRKSWTDQAAARALAIKKLRERIVMGKNKGESFTAAEVGSALALVSEFYLIEGRVKMIEEIEADLAKGPSAPAPAKPSTEAPPVANSWRLP